LERAVRTLCSTAGFTQEAVKRKPHECEPAGRNHPLHLLFRFLPGFFSSGDRRWIFLDAAGVRPSTRSDR
jgi:hypothetical protein